MYTYLIFVIFGTQYFGIQFHKLVVLSGVVGFCLAGWYFVWHTLSSVWRTWCLFGILGVLVGIVGVLFGVLGVGLA